MKRTFFAFLFCFFMIATIFSKDEKQIVIESRNYLSLGKVSLAFLYKNITVETKKLETGKSEITEKDYGQTSVDLFVRDSIFEALSSKHKITLVKENTQTDLNIRINPIYFTYEGTPGLICDVYLIDNSNKQIAKFLVKCDNLFFLHDIEEFNTSFLNKISIELDKLVKK